MIAEPTTAPVHDDDNQPAAKGDVRRAVEELAESTKSAFDSVATKEDLAAMEQRLVAKFATKDDLQSLKKDLVHEFKAIAENIHQDVAGANEDEISLIKDQTLPGHEERLQRLEEKAGLPVGSAT